MRCIDASTITNNALEAYDAMMIDCVVKAEYFAQIAAMVWGDVLEELEKRGKAKLVSGSYDDVGNALISRLK